MPMTVIVTRDVADRVRGFLASVTLEIAPGVYTAPAMSAAVRGRVWRVLEEWHAALGGGAIVMTWAEPKAPGGHGLAMLGTPPRELVEYDGLVLVRQRAPAPDGPAA